MRVLVFAIFILFVGCSQKQYFKPDKIDGEVVFQYRLDDSIIQSNKNGAVLDNGAVLTKNGIFNIDLKENFLFLNTSGNLLLVANYDDNSLVILNNDGVQLHKFDFEFMPVAASLRDKFLAVVLSDNSAKLLDLSTKQELFSNKSATVFSIDSKNASPLFADTTVMFPTLDGKILVVGLNNYQIERSITFGSGSYFANIIYLALDGEKLIIANNKKVISIVSGKEHSLDVNISDILYANDKIYILSIEGEVIVLDSLLNELNKKKFRFATLSGIVVKNNIYTLESQGFLIELEPNSFKDSIYEVNIDEYKNSFYSDDTIYYDDKIFVFAK